MKKKKTTVNFSKLFSPRLQYMQLRQIECRSCFRICVALVAGRGSIVIHLGCGSGGSRCRHFLKGQDTGPAGRIGFVPGDGDVRQKHVQIGPQVSDDLAERTGFLQGNKIRKGVYDTVGIGGWIMASGHDNVERHSVRFMFRIVDIVGSFCIIRISLDLQGQSMGDLGDAVEGDGLLFGGVIDVS